jgi:rhodanese-related sulfurtransferase
MQHGIQEISVEELHTDLTGPVLIDVREADEWKGGKVRVASFPSFTATH